MDKNNKALVFSFLLLFLLGSGAYFFRDLARKLNYDSEQRNTVTNDFQPSGYTTTEQQKQISEAQKEIDNLKVVAETRNPDVDEEVLKTLSNIRIDLRSAFQNEEYSDIRLWQDTDKQLETITKDLLAGIITPSDALEKASDTLVDQI